MGQTDSDVRQSDRFRQYKMISDTFSGLNFRTLYYDSQICERDLLQNMVVFKDLCMVNVKSTFN